MEKGKTTVNLDSATMATTEASSLLDSMEVRDEWQDDDFPR